MLVDKLFDCLTIDDTCVRNDRLISSFISAKRFEFRRWMTDTSLMLDKKKPLCGHRFLLVTGDPGIGKTYFLNNLVPTKDKKFCGHIDPHNPDEARFSTIVNIDDQVESILDIPELFDLSDYMKRANFSFCGSCNVVPEFLSLFDCVHLPIIDIDFKYSDINIDEMWEEIRNMYHKTI